MQEQALTGLAIFPSWEGINILDSSMNVMAKAFSPEGWQKVAGGQSEAETPDHAANKFLDPFQRVAEFFWHPFGVRIPALPSPGVCASLRPPATLCEPSGLKKFKRTMTDESSTSLPFGRGMSITYL